MRLTERTILAVGLATALAGAAWAQVSTMAFEKEFNAAEPITLTGKVEMVEWMKSAAWIHISTPGVDEAGKAKAGATSAWALKAATTDGLVAAGVKRDALVAGATVTIKGYRSLNPSCVKHPITGLVTCKGGARTLTMPNGCTVFIGMPGVGAPRDGADPNEGGKATTCKPG